MASGRAGARAVGIARLVEGLDRRRGLMGGAALEGLDRQIFLNLSRLQRLVVSGVETAVDGPVPREVALPLCLALSSQPHVTRTLADPRTPPSGPAARGRDRPVVFGRERRRDALGLQLWEVDELSADMDRRASLQLRQVRAVRWLWDHHGSSDEQELVRRLMMGAPEAGWMRARARGGRIYALVASARRASLHSLFLPWLAPPPSSGDMALSAFDARYVDGSLRESLARGVGASPQEVIALLDDIVCLAPEAEHQERMDRDGWRSSGAANLTGLASTDRRAHRLVSRLAPGSLRTSGWFDVHDGRVRLGDVEGAFERLAMQRVAQASRLVHAALIARLWSGPPIALDSDDLALLDVRHHVQSVLRPLLDWAESQSVADGLAHRLKADPGIVQAALGRVRERWVARAERWVELPSEAQPWPPVARLLDELVRFIAVLDNLIGREPLEEPHRDVFLLYAGHRVAEATELDLMPLDPDLPGIPETMATELWGAWKGLVARSDASDTFREPR